MSDLSQKLAKVGRAPARLSRDAWLLRHVENWREALIAEWTHTPLKQVRMRNGVVLESPPTIDLAFLFYETWLRRIYSPPGYEIGSGETIIDIGANIGVFATFAATQAPEVRVFSYEPFPENVEYLRNNVDKSGLTNVKVFQQAVSGDTGVRYLQVNSANWIVHSLFGESTTTEPGLPIDSVSFDDIMIKEGIESCDLLKLDCEGSEYEILQRCNPDTLSRVHRIVGEFHEGPHIHGTGEGLCRFLESRSFRIDNFKRDDGFGVLSAYNLAF
jgi:FkbM family methyltransferase